MLSGCNLYRPRLANQVQKGKPTKEEGQAISDDTSILVSKASDFVGVEVFRLDYAKIEMLLWLSESRDLDQQTEDLMGRWG